LAQQVVNSNGLALVAPLRFEFGAQPIGHFNKRLGAAKHITGKAASPEKRLALR
jgi:hypothetical protein